MGKDKDRGKITLPQTKEDIDKRMKYLGALGVLAECAVYVPEEIREQIERVFDDACADGSLQWRRILNRMEIEPKPQKKSG